MNLSRPTRNVFYISVVLAVLAILGQYFGVGGLGQYAFVLLLIAYILLFLGVTQRGW